MSESHDEVVRVAAGDLVRIEVYRQALAEAGIDSRVLGQSLEAGFGSALSGHIELYVKEEDVPRAEETLREVEARKGHGGAGAE